MENVYKLHLVHNYDTIFMDIELWSMQYPSFIRQLERINPDTKIILTREKRHGGHILEDAIGRGYKHISSVERAVMVMIHELKERVELIRLEGVRV